MRIGVDATCWANQRGYGRFARHIVTAMVDASPRDEFICYLDPLSESYFAVDAPNVRKVVVRTSASAAEAAAASGSRSINDMLAMTRAVFSNRPDVFFSPSVYTYFPLPPRLRAVVTIHDAIAERFPLLTLPSRRSRLFWKAKVWLALKQARSVITVSEYAASEVARIHGVHRPDIAVTLEAPASEFFPRSKQEVLRVAEKYALDSQSDWFVYVGGFNPHKNVRAIVSAHAALTVNRAKKPSLLMIGDARGDVFHSEVDAIRHAIDEAGTSESVHWLGYVPDADLAALLSKSVALVLPSESEGFGLPAIEAAACGTPVIATVESPLPQLLEGGGVFVAPGDVGAIQNAMSRLVDDTDFRNQCGMRALERAGELTWERSAQLCLAAIRKAAA